MPQYFDSTAAFPRKTKKRKGYYGGGRTNLLEELGRVEGERYNPNRGAEISRVHSELNRGYAKGDVLELKMGNGFRKLQLQSRKEEQKENVLLLQNQDVQDELKL